LTCSDAEKYLDPYADGELDLSASLEIEKHLKECAACSARYQNLTALKTVLTDGALYFEMPALLASRVRDSIRKSPGAGTSLRRSVWDWRNATAFLAILVVTLSAVYLLRGPSAQGTEDTIVQEIVSSHVRSLQANHLVDVPSCDQHTVKPWFNGKLDFSPQVTDLAAQGFPLAGGRLDYAENRTIAALVYQRRKHFINLFIWPSGGGEIVPAKELSRQGYNIVHWNGSDMTYWAITDAAMPDLEQFAQLLQHQ
jgi:anti-sigma factor RsiW